MRFMLFIVSLWKTNASEVLHVLFKGILPALYF